MSYTEFGYSYSAAPQVSTLHAFMYNFLTMYYFIYFIFCENEKLRISLHSELLHMMSKVLEIHAKKNGDTSRAELYNNALNYSFLCLLFTIHLPEVLQKKLS